MKKLFLLIVHFLTDFIYNCDENVTWNFRAVVSRNIGKLRNASPRHFQF